MGSLELKIRSQDSKAMTNLKQGKTHGPDGVPLNLYEFLENKVILPRLDVQI